MFVFPELFEIESECFTGAGRVTTSGAAYLDAVAVFGTFGALGVVVTTIYARIADRNRLVL